MFFYIQILSRFSLCNHFPGVSTGSTGRILGEKMPRKITKKKFAWYQRANIILVAAIFPFL